MKKSVITPLIAARTDGGDNPISTERTLWTTVTDALFGTPAFQNDGGSDTIIDGLNGSTFDFEVIATLNGGWCNLQGYIRNISGVTLINLNVLKFIDPDYFPIDDDSPSQASPYKTRFIGRTALGTEATFAIGWADISGTPTPVLSVEGNISPNTNAASYYSFNTTFLVKQT